MASFDPFAFTLFSVTLCCAIGALLLELWGRLDIKLLFKGYTNLSVIMSIGYVLITVLTIVGMFFLADMLTHHKFLLKI
jgi:hypothetical protein